MITYTHPIASNLPIKTFVARRLQTSLKVQVSSIVVVGVGVLVYVSPPHNNVTVYLDYQSSMLVSCS